MKGKYHKATFQEKRNALDVLGVKVYIYPDVPERPSILAIETDAEWLSISEASEVTGIKKNTLQYHIRAGELKVHRRGVSSMVIHRDEFATFLQARRPGMSLEQYQDEWLSVNKILTTTTIGYHTIHRAIRLGELSAQTVEVPHPFIHKDELNRFLQESPVRPKSVREHIQPRVEITYTPIFTGVQSSLG